MPVDKFGRTNVGTLQRVVSGGVTSSQVNNTFLRRDGENTATANISMDSHKLINVLDPTNDQDTATKHYVDSRVLLPYKQFLAPYADGLNSYMWKEYQVFPFGSSESEFDDLPAGLYACFTGYIPATRLGALPTNTKGYLMALTYQQPTDRNKYYKWIDSTNGDEWEAYFKTTVWNTWVKSSKVSKAGDTMSGDLNMGGKLVRGLPVNYPPLYVGNEAVSWTQAVGLVTDATTNNATVPTGNNYLTNKKYVDDQDALKVNKAGDTMTGNLFLNVGADLLRTLGCSDLSGSKGFSILLGSIPNQIQCQLNQPIAIQASDGIVCRQGASNIIRFGRAAGDLRTDVYQDIVMNQRYIADLADPNSAQDAATKNYVDDRAYLFVDRFPPVDMTGLTAPAPFVVTTNNSAASGWFAFAHMDSQDWLCSGPTGAWVQVVGDFRFVLKRLVVRGSFTGNLGTITSWNLAGFNDAGANFVVLANQSSPGAGTLTQNSAYTILLPNNTLAFKGYRFNCTGGSGTVSINYIGLYNGISNFDVYGDNKMLGNINMDLRRVINLTDPSSSGDAANKGYVDANAASWMTATPTMTANTSVIDGLTYVASASSIASTGIYQPWQSSQNFVIFDGWVGASPNNQWLQMQYPFPVSMSGFNIVARNISGRNITSWRVQASNNGSVFTDIVPTNNTAFNAGVLNRFTFTASAKFQYWRFFIVTSTGPADVGIGMLQWIPTLTDRYLKKCHVGYVPRLTANTNYRGFVPSASSEFSASYIAANAFKGDYVSGAGVNGEWATASVNSNFWIRIACPVPVRTWKFGFRGRDSNTQRIFDWRIEGSTDNTIWNTLFTAPNPTFLGSTYQEFLVDSVGKFQFYRLFVVNAEVTSPGLSSMQLFVYDD